MTATRADIIRWVKEAQKKKATHLIVAVDQFDHDNYPVFVMPGEDAERRTLEVGRQSMQAVDEVYSFTGKHTIESQLAERRARHYD